MDSDPTYTYCCECGDYVHLTDVTAGVCARCWDEAEAQADDREQYGDDDDLHVCPMCDGDGIDPATFERCTECGGEGTDLRYI